MLYKGKFYDRFFLLFCDILRNKTIFIAALDWGLGHATRCVPLIKQLKENNRIIIGITPITALIFNEEFPDLERISIDPYQITYSKWMPLSMKLFLDSPRILKVIKKEHQQLKNIVKEHRVNVVISDNRFGLYNRNAECIYLTHQLNIQAGLFSFLANKIHHHFIKKFNKVWVPDFEDRHKSLAGKLSRMDSLENVSYIGPQSRLNINTNPSTKLSDYLCLLSGPEPLRTELEFLLLEKAKTTNKKICLVRGSNQPLNFILQNVTVYNLPTASELCHLIQSSKIILCRSGYSTLMDLHCLNSKQVILIPTPGQTEQQYLAQYWSQQYGASAIDQKDLHDFCF